MPRGLATRWLLAHLRLPVITPLDELCCAGGPWSAATVTTVVAAEMPCVVAVGSAGAVAGPPVPPFPFTVRHNASSSAFATLCPAPATSAWEYGQLATVSAVVSVGPAMPLLHSAPVVISVLVFLLWCALHCGTLGLPPACAWLWTHAVSVTRVVARSFINTRAALVLFLLQPFGCAGATNDVPKSVTVRRARGPCWGWQEGC